MPAAKSPVPPRTGRPHNFAAIFKQWLVVRNETDQGAFRQEELRVELLGLCSALGHEDDKGNYWLSLPEPIEFEDFRGKKRKFFSLKSERRLSNPQVDAEKAEALLRRLKMWPGEDVEATLRKIKAKFPFIKITIAVDAQQVTQGYFKGQLTEHQYTSILTKPTPTYAFIPSEK